jgi:hypothetical protein
MVAGLLAILKTGAAYLPLDPDLPEARLRLLLEDAQPAIILTDRAARAKLPPSNAAMLLCDDVITSFVADDERLVDSDDLALQCVDVIARGGGEGCELILGVAPFCFQPQLAALKIMQFGLQLHPGLSACRQFAERRGTALHQIDE